MKKDLFNECFDERLPPAAFKQVFCGHCRNPTCSLAGWAADQFGARNAIQEERLYNPNVAHPDDPRYGRLKEQDFPSLFHKAVRLEIADRRGDWSLPESNVVLAPIDPEPASSESQDLVKEAVLSLKRENNPETISDEVIDRGSSDTPESELRDQEDQDQVTPPEIPPEQPEQNLASKTEKTEKSLEASAKASVERHQHPNQKNTDFEEGLMLEGASEFPSDEKTKQQRVQDSWKPSKVIEPGSTVNMGKKK